MTSSVYACLNTPYLTQLPGSSPHGRITQIELISYVPPPISVDADDSDDVDASSTSELSRDVRYRQAVDCVQRRMLSRTTHAGSIGAVPLHEFVNPPKKFDERGTVEVKVVVKAATEEVLQVRARDEHGSWFESLPFAVRERVMRCTTLVSEWEAELEWGKSELEWPKSFLKDVGKKDKTMEFDVKVVPPFLKNSVSVPLRAVLVYADGLVVPDQKILSMMNSVMSISAEDQSMQSFRFRINEVSKNHQSKPFCVVIEPLEPEARSSIAPAVCYPVLVLSKKNKRAKSPLRERSSAAVGLLDDVDEDHVVEPKRRRTSRQAAAAAALISTTQAVAAGAPLVPVDAVNFETKWAKNAQDFDHTFKRLNEAQIVVQDSVEKLKIIMSDRAQIEQEFREYYNKRGTSTAAAATAAISSTAVNMLTGSMSDGAFLNNSSAAWPLGENSVSLALGAASVSANMTDMLPSAAIGFNSSMYPMDHSLAMNISSSTSEVYFLQDQFIPEPRDGKYRLPLYGRNVELLGFYTTDLTFVKRQDSKDADWCNATENAASANNTRALSNPCPIGNAKLLVDVRALLAKWRGSNSGSNSSSSGR